MTKRQKETHKVTHTKSNKRQTEVYTKTYEDTQMTHTQKTWTDQRTDMETD